MVGEDAPVVGYVFFSEIFDKLLQEDYESHLNDLSDQKSFTMNILAVSEHFHELSNE